MPFVDQLVSNLSLPTKFIQVILGPRQVGKTTCILHFLKHEYQKEFLYHSADEVFSGGASWLQNLWEQARARKALLVVDEIQKIENWAAIVKMNWDKDQMNKHTTKCILVGSSSLDLHRGLTESLAGRFQLIKAYHWSYQESYQLSGITFDAYLQYGGHPGSYPLIQNTSSWISYVRHSIIEAVIDKDILLNNKVKSPALFKQCFDILVSLPAQEISYIKLLGQIQDRGNVEVVKYYLNLFEGAFLFRFLSKFSGAKLRSRKSSPKVLPLCPAFTYLSELSDYRPETKGHVFEAVVGQVLNRLDCELFYWREGAHEVDFIVKKGREIWAIEVKSGRRNRSFGMNEFIKRYPQSHVVIITPDNFFDFEASPETFLSMKI